MKTVIIFYCRLVNTSIQKTVHDANKDLCWNRSSTIILIAFKLDAVAQSQCKHDSAGLTLWYAIRYYSFIPLVPGNLWSVQIFVRLLLFPLALFFHHLHSCYCWETINVSRMAILLSILIDGKSDLLISRCIVAGQVNML